MADTTTTRTEPLDEALEETGLDPSNQTGAQPQQEGQDLGNQPVRNEAAGDQPQMGTHDVYQTDEGGAATAADVPAVGQGGA